jgi:hypothetical protein
MALITQRIDFPGLLATSLVGPVNCFIEAGFSLSSSQPNKGISSMAEPRKIHESISGSRTQHREVWSLIKADDGKTIVLHERFCRDKGERKFRRIEERQISVLEAMSEGGKLAKNLWEAMPD